MSLLDALWHVLGFVMPAAFVAVTLASSGRFFKQKMPIAGTFFARSAILFIVSLSVLIAGLLITGRDGKMVTYLAMVFAAATAQWVLSGSWRR